MNVIDLDKLENKQRQSDGSFIARCPCCASRGQDRTGNHLRVWPTGQFNCILAGRDKEHNSQILSLAGTEGTGEITYYMEQYVQAPKIPKEWDLSILNGLVKNYSYWNSRGISNETCEKFSIGVATQYQMARRSVIPLFNKTKNKIIGFTGRALEKEMKPKYKHLGQRNSFFMVGDEKIVARSKKIILVESPADLLYLYELDIKNTICLFGVDLNPRVLSELLVLNPDEIIIATNNELDSKNKGVGNMAAIKIRKKLLQFFASEKISIALPAKKDFGEMTPEEVKLWANTYLT